VTDELRVLFITGEFPPMQGGVGDCTNEIAHSLAALNVDVQVLTSTRAQPAIRHSPFTIRPTVSNWNWSSLRTIDQVCREFKPDIVHIQYQTGAFGLHPAINLTPPLVPLFPSFPSHIRFVATFHDLLPPYLFPKAGAARDWVTRVLAQSCDAVISTNDDDYLKLETWNLEHLDLIPIGSNITTEPIANYQREAWRAKLGVAENETLLCYFGFLNESKGGETLIRALAQLPNAKLLMIGGQVGASDPTNIAYLAKIKSLISDLQLTNRIIWTDHVPPEIVSAHFYASDICVMPYRDGASYRRGTLMAALAHGMAIVTTVNSQQSTVDSDRLPRLIDSENCLLVTPDNPQAIASAVHRLMSSSELRTRIGAGAHELAQHFTWDKIAQQHLELYERSI